MEVVRRWWRDWTLRWRLESFGIGTITRNGLDVFASPHFFPPHKCVVRTETELN